MGAAGRRLYQRPEQPKPVVLTERDQQILLTIHAFDGMMSLKQLWKLYFPDCTSDVQPRKRLRDLCNNGYLTMPRSEEELRWVPLGETVYWLDAEGAQVVAEHEGKVSSDFYWRKPGRWSKIAHDLSVNDFRISLSTACITDQEVRLADWVPESSFLRSRDSVTYQKHDGTNQRRIIQPDGWFQLEKLSERYPGRLMHYGFLLEIDMGTESATRFGRDKVPTGIAYLKSELYRKRFKVPYGRFAVVTTGRDRLNNMKVQTERLGGERLFLFSTFDRVNENSVLHEPIWQEAGSERFLALLPPND